jgi:plasmid stabilization system protein ParE
VIRVVSFTPAARLEFIEAIDWYEARAAGLGAAFEAETEHQIARIQAKPMQFPIMLEDVRRARLRRFPYGLFFRIVDNEAFVIACFHASRDPKVWQNRV